MKVSKQAELLQPGILPEESWQGQVTLDSKVSAELLTDRV